MSRSQMVSFFFALIVHSSEVMSGKAVNTPSSRSRLRLWMVLPEGDEHHALAGEGGADHHRAQPALMPADVVKARSRAPACWRMKLRMLLLGSGCKWHSSTCSTLSKPPGTWKPSALRSVISPIVASSSEVNQRKALAVYSSLLR